MLKRILLILVAVGTLSCASNNDAEVVSPDKKVQVSFFLNQNGTPQYQVRFNNEEVIKTSKMGFTFENIPSFEGNFEIVNSELTSFNETWEMPWGEQTEVVNNYNQLAIQLKEKSDLGRLLNVTFRVYNDGIGFRYEIPEQENIEEVLIADENTEFNLTGDHKVWWIPGDWDIYEHLYTESKFSEIDATSKANHGNLAQTYIPVNAVNTPVTMRAANGVHLSFHEAALVDYSGMTLAVDTENMTMKSNLVGSDNTSYKVKRTAPFNTPWRTIQISSKATELIDSKLIVNLNESNKLEDISWFKPMKYTGIWWEMHLGKSSWDLASGRHGATTENAKAFIDFSAENNIGGVLVEGWNT